MLAIDARGSYCRHESKPFIEEKEMDTSNCQSAGKGHIADRITLLT